MKYYKRVNESDETTTVEGYSHNGEIEGAIEITKEEYDSFIASMPPPKPPPKTTTELKLEEFELRLNALEVK